MIPLRGQTHFDTPVLEVQVWKSLQARRFLGDILLVDKEPATPLG
jgi:hypothetical protein